MISDGGREVDSDDSNTADTPPLLVAVAALCFDMAVEFYDASSDLSNFLAESKRLEND